MTHKSMMLKNILSFSHYDALLFDKKIMRDVVSWDLFQGFQGLPSGLFVKSEQASSGHGHIFPDNRFACDIWLGRFDYRCRYGVWLCGCSHTRVCQSVVMPSVTLLSPMPFFSSTMLQLMLVFIGLSLILVMGCGGKVRHTVLSDPSNCPFRWQKKAAAAPKAEATPADAPKADDKPKSKKMSKKEKPVQSCDTSH